MSDPQNMNKPVAVNESPTNPFATQKPDNMNDKPAVEDRHRECASAICGPLHIRMDNGLPELIAQVIAQHEAKEIRELRDDCDDWRTEANTSNDYIRLLGTLLGCDDGDDIPEVRIEAMKDQIRLLAAERDRLRAALVSLGGYALSVNTDRKYFRDDTEFFLQTEDWCQGLLDECKAADEALSAKHDRGGE